VERINIDRNKCISCLTCVTACSVAHNGEESRNRVVMSDEGVSSPIFCRHCDLPECVYTCMTGAMSKDPETGYVLYDKTKCASCFMCVMACPYGVLKADDRRHKEILKCDMCLYHESKTAQCVANCPMQAITLQEVVR
jgi:carbon-monoxide dehydrogenase iron sulfur subunit